jgi:hypothetical protein
MRSIGAMVCVLPSHIPNPPSVNPCSQVTHILGLRPGCAQPLFAIMHRSRTALLQRLRQVVQVKQRGRRVVAVADPGSRQRAGVSVSRACDPKPRTPIPPPHCATRPAHPVSKTGRRAREAPRAARHGADQPCVRRASPGAMDIPVDQTASAWALLTGDRALHENAARMGAGRRGRRGSLRQRGDRGARAPIPILSRRSPSSASRDG